MSHPGKCYIRVNDVRIDVFQVNGFQVLAIESQEGRWSKRWFLVGGGGEGGDGAISSGSPFKNNTHKRTQNTSPFFGETSLRLSNLPGLMLREWIDIAASVVASTTTGGGWWRECRWWWWWWWRWLLRQCCCGASAQTPCIDIVQVFVPRLERGVYVRVSIANEPVGAELGNGRRLIVSHSRWLFIWLYGLIFGVGRR